MINFAPEDCLGASVRMFRHKGKLVALLCCVSGLIAYGQDSPLRVEIKLAHAAVNNFEPFSVATSIRNVSKEVQTLDIWSCSYPTQWAADIPPVRVNLVSCKKNDLLHLTLKPGETCERSLLIRVELPGGNSSPEPVTFRLGFKAAAFAMGQQNAPIWSDPATVTVNK